MPPGELNGNLVTLTASFEAIRLTGTMRDALGYEHPIEEVFADLAKWREVARPLREVSVRSNSSPSGRRSVQSPG